MSKNQVKKTNVKEAEKRQKGYRPVTDEEILFVDGFQDLLDKSFVDIIENSDMTRAAFAKVMSEYPVNTLSKIGKPSGADKRHVNMRILAAMILRFPNELREKIEEALPKTK